VDKRKHELLTRLDAGAKNHTPAKALHDFKHREQGPEQEPDHSPHTGCDQASNQTTFHQRCRTDGKGPKGREIQHENSRN
jgi:hypothetical protein